MELMHAFQKYGGLLCNYAYSYLNNREEAEDVVQEVFLQLLETEKVFPFNDIAIKSYLLKSVRNSCLNILKKKKHFLFTCCILTCFLCFGFFRPSTDAYYISFIFAVQWIISFILSSFAEFPYNHVNKISRLDILGNIVSSIPFLVVFYWCIAS